MELNYLSEFVVFARYLNISKASRKLHLSQSTLSHHISSLEKDFGVSLIDRTMPISLTAAGRVLVRQASELLKGFDAMVDQLHDAANESLELFVALNDTRTAPHHSLYAALFRFGKLHPEVYIHYVNCNDSTAAAALTDSRLDCVGVILCPIPSDLEDGVEYLRVPALYPNHLHVWMDKRHPLAAKEELHWEDLNGIHMPLPSNFNRLWGSTMPQILRNHGVEVVTSLHGLDPQSFLYSVGEDEVQIYDESWKNNVAIGVDDNRFLKRIDEPDAVAESYIAFRPERVSSALGMFMDYLKTLEDEYPAK